MLAAWDGSSSAAAVHGGGTGGGGGNKTTSMSITSARLVSHGRMRKAVALSPPPDSIRSTSPTHASLPSLPRGHTATFGKRRDDTRQSRARTVQRQNSTAILQEMRRGVRRSRSGHTGASSSSQIGGNHLEPAATAPAPLSCVRLLLASCSCHIPCDHASDEKGPT